MRPPRPPRRQPESPPVRSRTENSAPESAALVALRAAHPNSLSPREALDLIYKLQTLDRGEP